MARFLAFPCESALSKGFTFALVSLLIFLLGNPVAALGPGSIANYNTANETVNGPYLGGPRIDTVTFKYYPDVASQVSALLSNQIDFLGSGIGGSSLAYFSPLTSLLSNPNVTVGFTPAPDFFFTAFNMRRFPFNYSEFDPSAPRGDLNIRRAISLVTPKSLIVDLLLSGGSFGVRLDSEIPPLVYGCAVETAWQCNEIGAAPSAAGLSALYSLYDATIQNITRAQQIVNFMAARFGWVNSSISVAPFWLWSYANGTHVRFDYHAPDSDPVRMAAGAIISTNIRKLLHIDSQMVAEPFGQIIGELYTSHDYYVDSIGFVFQIPNYLGDVFGSTSPDNVVGFSNSTFDGLTYLPGGAENDPSVTSFRVKYLQAQKILDQELPFNSLYETSTVGIGSSGWHGYFWEPGSGYYVQEFDARNFWTFTNLHRFGQTSPGGSFTVGTSSMVDQVNPLETYFLGSELLFDEPVRTYWNQSLNGGLGGWYDYGWLVKGQGNDPRIEGVPFSGITPGGKHIYNGMHFHYEFYNNITAADGSPVNAATLNFTIGYLQKHPGTNLDINVKNITSVELSGSNLVADVYYNDSQAWYLKYYLGSIPILTSGFWSGISDPVSLDERNPSMVDFAWRAAATTGPFKFQSADFTNGVYTFVRRTDYFRSTSYQTTVVTLNCGGRPCSVQTDSTVLGAGFGGNTLSFTVAGPTGTLGYANVTIPVATLPAIYMVQVYVNGVLLPSSALTVKFDTSHYYLYFTYTFHSPVTVDVSLSVSVIGFTALLVFTAALVTIPSAYYGRRAFRRRIGTSAQSRGF